MNVEKNNDSNIKIAFSSRFMMDAIKTVESKDVLINFNSDNVYYMCQNDFFNRRNRIWTKIKWIS